MRLGTTNIFLLCATNLFITDWDSTAHNGKEEEMGSLQNGTVLVA